MPPHPAVAVATQLAVYVSDRTRSPDRFGDIMVKRRTTHTVLNQNYALSNGGLLGLLGR